MDDESDDDVETVFENLVQLKYKFLTNSKREEVLEFVFEFGGLSPPTRYFIHLALNNFFIFYPCKLSKKKGFYTLKSILKHFSFFF